MFVKNSVLLFLFLLFVDLLKVAMQSDVFICTSKKVNQKFLRTTNGKEEDEEKKENRLNPSISKSLRICRTPPSG